MYLLAVKIVLTVLANIAILYALILSNLDTYALQYYCRWTFVYQMTLAKTFIFCMLRCKMPIYLVKLLTKLRCLKHLLNTLRYIISLLLQVYNKPVSCFSLSLWFLWSIYVEVLPCPDGFELQMEYVIVTLILEALKFTLILVRINSYTRGIIRGFLGFWKLKNLSL